MGRDKSMFRTLKMLAAVPVIMACALGGTVGLIKAIETIMPDRGSAKDAP